MTCDLLKGKRVVVTRGGVGGREWKHYLEKRGAKVDWFPTIATAPIGRGRTQRLKDSLAHLDGFGWIVFTSAAAPRHLKTAMRKYHIAVSKKKMPLIAGIGKKTAAAVKAIGYDVAFVPSKANATTLARELKPLRSPILLLRADIASDELPRALAARGARVIDLPIYKTTRVRATANGPFLEIIKNKKIDYFIFASPSAVRGFVLRVRKTGIKNARRTIAIALGARTADALRDAGFYTIRVAREATIEGIADAIVRRARYTV
jgi:uroporphyrinogen-III synthase